MNDIAKGMWLASDHAVELRLPLSKVNEEKREVSGFATLDNIDTQNDVVTPEASMKAFKRTRARIREQHNPLKPVGIIKEFREGEFFDPDANNGLGEMYRGVYVTAYVSKGAQDTWEKVLDGTLSGFSIGGEIVDSSSEIAKSGKKVRIINDYELTELSLVDNPANQLANIFSIQKAADGTDVIKGMIAESLTETETVFYCKADGTAEVSQESELNCPQCDGPMDEIGFFEVGGDKLQKVRDIIDTFIKSEGGVTMSKKEEVKIEKSEEAEVVEPADVNEVEEADGIETPEPATEVDEVNEVVDEEDTISKKIDDLTITVENALELSKTEKEELLKSIEAKIAANDEAANEKFSKLESKLDELSNGLEVTKGKLVEFEQSLQKMNSSTAFKKSADVESEEQTVKQSKWNGAFSTTNLV